MARSPRRAPASGWKRILSFAWVTTQPPASGLLAPNRSSGHLPNDLCRLSHAFEGHALADGIDRHQPKRVDTDKLDSVSRIGRKAEWVLKNTQIELPEG